MACYRGARTAREEAQLVGEPRKDVFDAQEPDARGGELDGQRDTVEASTDLRRLAGCLVGDRISRADALRAIEEQGQRAERGNLLDREFAIGRRKAKRWNAPRDLAGDAERLAACRDDPN